MKAPCTSFGQTKMVDVNVYLNGKKLQEVFFEWDETIGFVVLNSGMVLCQRV